MKVSVKKAIIFVLTSDAEHTYMISKQMVTETNKVRSTHSTRMIGVKYDGRLIPGEVKRLSGGDYEFSAMLQLGKVTRQG